MGDGSRLGQTRIHRVNWISNVRSSQIQLITLSYRCFAWGQADLTSNISVSSQGHQGLAVPVGALNGMAKSFSIGSDSIAECPQFVIVNSEGV